MFGRQFASFIGLAAVGVGSANAAGAGPVVSAVPASIFLQVGMGDQSTRAYLGGLTWDWNWQQHYGVGTFSGYFEAAFGRWTTHNDPVNSYAWMTQLGVTPVLRLRPSGLTHWFAEIGVGANYILPLYRSGYKRFSTEFNFGDHFAIGREFGARSQFAAALRVEHFSNAGIDHPNPGENFVQLRLSYRP
jgi:hypothetical protein